MNYFKILKDLIDKRTEVEIGVTWCDICNQNIKEWQVKADKLYTKLINKIIHIIRGVNNE